MFGFIKKYFEKRRKLRVYKIALKRLVTEYNESETNNHVLGLCTVIARGHYDVCGLGEPMFSEQVVDKYPEILKYKPKDNSHGSILYPIYWFDLNEEGYLARKIILEQIIKKLS